MPSAGQFAAVLGIFFSIAGFVWLMRRHFARRYGVPLSRLRWISGGIALFGIAFAIATAMVVRAVEPSVVFRDRLPGTAGMRTGGPAIMRAARFNVVHVGREHVVRVRAIPEKEVEARGPIQLRLSVVGPGESALADTDLVLPVRPRRTWLSVKSEWAIGSVGFYPRVTGRYVLRLVPLNAGIRCLDVTVIAAPA
jgi:hypothetical protein